MSNTLLDSLRGKLRRNLPLLKNPRFMLMRGVGRFDALQPLCVSAVRRAPPHLYPERESIFEDLDVDSALEAMRSDGYAPVLQLPPRVLQEILEYAMSSPCYGGRDRHTGFLYKKKKQMPAKFPKLFPTAHYYNTAAECSAIKTLQTDPKLLSLAARYLNAEPVHQGNTMWWSFAVEASQEERSRAAQFFHFDLDDYKFIKFFFYLTNVAEGDGPHVYVRGTHRDKKFQHQMQVRRYSDAEIVQAYGQANIIMIYGAAGSGFAEDTRGMHKGTPPVSGDRLLLQLEYGVSDYQVQSDVKEIPQTAAVAAGTTG